ncbi:MAG: hypothetical protein M1826_002912 [Phylliscum demangeonii]|nr:MAG: hypothetical protein M1826_002912 [Phylliscum demangeonii]
MTMKSGSWPSATARDATGDADVLIWRMWPLILSLNPSRRFRSRIDPILLPADTATAAQLQNLATWWLNASRGCAASATGAQAGRELMVRQDDEMGATKTASWRPQQQRAKPPAMPVAELRAPMHLPNLLGPALAPGWMVRRLESDLKVDGHEAGQLARYSIGSEATGDAMPVAAPRAPMQMPFCTQSGNVADEPMSDGNFKEADESLSRCCTP